MKKFWIILIYVVLIIAVIALCAYQVFFQKDLDTGSLVRFGIIFIGIIASMVKHLSGGKQRIINKKETYKAAYPELIGNAFSDEPKLEKRLYAAIHDFNQRQYRSALKKLSALRKECHRAANYYTVAAFTALCYDDLGQYREAIEQYSYALQIRENTTLASNLGICYERTGNKTSAIEAYERAIRADGKNPYPYNNLAQFYIRELEFEKALSYAQTAVELNNRMVQALKAMAICYAMLGNYEQYEKHFRQAVACGANAKNLKAYIENLKEEID